MRNFRKPHQLLFDEIVNASWERLEKIGLDLLTGKTTLDLHEKDSVEFVMCAWDGRWKSLFQESGEIHHWKGLHYEVVLNFLKELKDQQVALRANTQMAEHQAPIPRPRLMLA